MLLILLFIAALLIGFVCQTRRHFSRLVPPYRVDGQHGPLQVRRYPKLAVAEVRVSGSAQQALSTGSKLLNKYFREEQLARFALPLFAEKVDAADAIWNMSALLPMELSAAPAPRNKAIQLKEIAPQRVFARYFHGSVAEDDRLAKQKADMLPLVNDLCRRLGAPPAPTPPFAPARRLTIRAPARRRVHEVVDGGSNASLPVVVSSPVPGERPDGQGDGRVGLGGMRCDCLRACLASRPLLRCFRLPSRPLGRGMQYFPRPIPWCTLIDLLAMAGLGPDAVTVHVCLVRAKHATVTNISHGRIMA